MNKLEIRSLLGLIALYATRMLGLFMVLPVLSLYVSEYSGSTTFLLGVALGIYGLTQGLLQIPLGMLSDRIGRKAVILGGMGLFLVGSLVAAQADSVAGLIIGRALQGAGAVASTIMALLSDLTTEENRTKAMAAVGGSIGISFALAMVLGPVLASFGGLQLIFWITAVLAALGILVVLWIPTPQTASRLATSEALTMPALFKATLKNTELLRLDMGVCVLHMVQMASWVSIPFILRERLGFGLEQHWWLYLLTMGLGFVVMLPLIIVGERRRRLKHVFVAAILLLAVAEALFFKSQTSFALFAFAMFLFFTAFNLLEATLPSLVSKITPGGSRGTAMGIYSSSQFLGAFLGGVAGGYIAHNFGYQYVFLFSALAVLIWAGVALTMPNPRHWGTVVIDLASHPHIPADGAAVRRLLKGVEEVTCILDRELIYLKVDKDRFDKRQLEALLRNTGMTSGRTSG